MRNGRGQKPVLPGQVIHANNLASFVYPKSVSDERAGKVHGVEITGNQREPMDPAGDLVNLEFDLLAKYLERLAAVRT